MYTLNNPICIKVGLNGTKLHILKESSKHTVNNLQQKLNHFKLIQIYVVKQKLNMCENFRTIHLVLCNIQIFRYKRVKIESHNKWNLGLSLHISGTILISFVVPNKRTFAIRNA